MKIINEKLIEKFKSGEGIKLHLGSGPVVKEGFYNLDLFALDSVDIVADMNQPFELIPDNSVTCIYTSHALEHVKNLQGLMKEISRICISGSKIIIIVPHFSNPYYYSDPTHVRTFGLYSMSYFIDPKYQPFKRKVPSYYTSTEFKLIETQFYFYRTSLIDRILVPLVRYVANFNISTQEFFERRWSWLYPAWQIKYILRAK